MVSGTLPRMPLIRSCQVDANAGSMPGPGVSRSTGADSPRRCRVLWTEELRTQVVRRTGGDHSTCTLRQGSASHPSSHDLIIIPRARQPTAAREALHFHSSFHLIQAHFLTSQARFCPWGIVDQARRDTSIIHVPSNIARPRARPNRCASPSM